MVILLVMTLFVSGLLTWMLVLANRIAQDSARDVIRKSHNYIAEQVDAVWSSLQRMLPASIRVLLGSVKG